MIYSIRGSAGSADKQENNQFCIDSFLDHRSARSIPNF